eukprot:9036394-Alexandrium_andersonii.AAC.1
MLANAIFQAIAVFSNRRAPDIPRERLGDLPRQRCTCLTGRNSCAPVSALRAGGVAGTSSPMFSADSD